MESLVLTAGGLLAVLAGGLVIFLGPGRVVPLVAGAALALLGLLQFGFARSVFELTTWSRSVWFAHSLALALPVSALWLLLALSIGRGPNARGLGLWRPYLALQGLASAAALVSASLRRDVDVPALSRSAPAFPIHADDRWILLLVLVNLMLVAARFEATHLSLPRRYRRAFRPSLAGILIAVGFFGYTISSSLLARSFAVSDLALGAAPVTLLSFVLPLSLIRGRVAEARAMRERHRVLETSSLLIAGGFLFGTSALLWLTHAIGMSPARGFFILAVAFALLAVLALTVSNRVRRRVLRLVDPLWYDPRAARLLVSPRVVTPLERATSLTELCAMIPSNARELAGLDPVTLFLVQSESDPVSFRAVASTIDPRPSVVVQNEDPLAEELRRARRPIRLRGRTDDLEYVSIYVENAEQIGACGAACAVPLAGEEGLVGFLLCGPKEGGSSVPRAALVLLHTASRDYAGFLERMARSR